MAQGSSQLRTRSLGATRAPTPYLRFTGETVIRESLGSEDFEEIQAALIELMFDYDGVLVGGDELASILRGRAPLKVVPIVRNTEAENRARYLLESFGALELACLDDLAAPPDSAAEYLVDIDGDIHALCSFSAYVIPQLRSLGWRVEVDASYPCHIVETEAPWYCKVDDGDNDWFGLELGVEIEGRRQNLLPGLLDLLETIPESASIDSVVRKSKRFFALPLGNQSYLPIPPERLGMLMRVLRDLYAEGGKGPARQLPSAHAVFLGDLEQALTADGAVLEWEGNEELRRRGQAIRQSQESAPIDEPTTLRATLRPYQREGLAWLQCLRRHGMGGVLADDMGLGKTLQTIAHLVLEKESGRALHPSLVVAPTSLVFNWKREIERFAPHLVVTVWHGPKRHRNAHRIAESDVVLTTYALLNRDEEILNEHSFYLLVLDEAQAVKNHRSQAHRAVVAVDARHRLCLSGTPLENNLEELWSLFNFLMPGYLLDLESFRARFRFPIERGGARDRLEDLQKRVSPFILRRMKDTVAKDLPPKTEIVLPVELSGAQRELYESIRVAAHSRVRQTIVKKGIAASTITILDALMKLRQVCCDPRLVSVASARDVEETAKFEQLFELLDTQLGEGRRVLIFSQFTSMLGLISEELARQDIAHVSLTGSTQNRQKPIDAFQSGEVDVFLISLKAGGTGLNLTRADTVIHYDPWWNPAAQAQATDRAYRIGQENRVFVYNLIVAGSVEERMVQLQQRKRDLASSILAPGEGGPLDLSGSDLDDLFAPLGL